MKHILTAVAGVLMAVSSTSVWADEPANLGPRPAYLVNSMDDSS